MGSRMRWWREIAREECKENHRQDPSPTRKRETKKASIVIAVWSWIWKLIRFFPPSYLRLIVSRCYVSRWAKLLQYLLFLGGGKTVSLPSDPQFNLFLLLSPEQIANSRWILDSNFAIAMPASFITSSNWAGNFGAIEPSREDNDLEDANEKGAEDFDARMYVTGSCQRSFPLRTTYISVPFHSIFWQGRSRSMGDLKRLMRKAIL